MKTKLLSTALALGLVMSPLASFAGGVGGGNANSSWTIYGWQNWAMDFRSSDHAGGSRDRIRMENEAANIGFAASIDTGMSMGGVPIKANFQCEQFTTFNRLAGFDHNGWCNRNSKLGLSGPWGEVMASGWLTPYNEVTAQSIDPFYDAGSHTHSTLLGLVGWGVNYGNTGFDGSDDFKGWYGEGVGGQGFMRRKSNMWQWFSPASWGGLHVRVGWSNFNTNSWTTDEATVTDSDGNTHEIDPEILSIGASYTTNVGNGNELWVAIGYQQHDEWAASSLSCADSDDETIRYAVKYTHDWGNGHSTRISAAYEEMEYDWEKCSGTKPLETFTFNDGENAFSSGGPFAYHLTGGMVDFERDAWLISGKHDFPGPLDFRFMYMEADDFECGNSMKVMGLTGDNATYNGNDCAGINESDSGAEAYSVGLYYTFPAGTELRLVYGEVDNDKNSKNGFGINSVGSLEAGGKEESWQIGMVQWF